MATGHCTHFAAQCFASSFARSAKAAALTVKERPHGPVFERWVPFPAPPVSPPVSKTGRRA